MERVSTLGRMEEDTRDHTFMIRSMVMENILGQMEGNITVNIISI
jgi:hypothetical protein